MTADFTKADLSELYERRSRIAKLYSFWKRYVNILIEDSPNLAMGLALIDKDGYTLDLEGGPDFLQELAQDGVTPDLIWSFKSTGDCAVTLGLAGRKTLFTSGAENSARSLQKYTLYFAPLSLTLETAPYETRHYGGVALLLPLNCQKAEFMITIRSIAHDLSLNLQFSQVANMLYERSSEGIFTVDREMNTYPTLTHCSKSMFDIFGLPDTDLKFHPLTDLIDPAPANEKLWDIIDNLQRVHQLHMTISAQGHKVSCIVSTDTYHQEPLRTSGVIFYINTEKRISSEISSKMGNSAILSFDDIIGKCPAIIHTKQLARRMTLIQSNILLQGESGTGKDLFAQAIHNGSDRRNKPFIIVNCGALPHELIASELFGYSSGAFTGAKQQGNIGKFELANGGTIFLDEIGELPLDLQATLLRAVEQKKITRLGSNKEIDIDVKVISATNANLMQMINERKFRLDLYYRLSTMQLNIPPLRERGEDVILLSEYFIRKICRQIGRNNTMMLSPEAKNTLLNLSWPGNIRELRNTFERIVQLYPEDTITPEHILANVNSVLFNETPAISSRAFPADSVSPGYGSLTKQRILEALEICYGNRTKAAKYLHISRKTLYRHMEQLGIPNKSDME